MARRKSHALMAVGAMVLTAGLVWFAVEPVGSADDCQEGVLPSGALMRMCVPSDWNGTLVLYAHGYVPPNRELALPDYELALPGGGTVGDLITGLGYAFATTSYRTNGLAVAVALDDLRELSAAFSAAYGAPQQRLLVGVSEGGLVTVLAAERQPRLYDGVLALCGPIGSFDVQINYLGDFRVLFDYFFPDLIPPSAVEVPPVLIDSWELVTYATYVEPVIFDPSNRAALEQLLTVAGIAHLPDVPSSARFALYWLLWHNILATNDAHVRLGGQPYDNMARVYIGSADDAALNAGVPRYQADPAALATIAADYETSGALQIPVVTVHTSLDPIVPVWHSAAYSNKAAAAGGLAWHEGYVLERFGHCNFTASELLSFFNRVADLAATRTHATYLPTLTGGISSPAQPRHDLRVDGDR